MNNLILNRMFTQITFNKLLENHTSNTYCYIAYKYALASQEDTNALVISKIYSFLKKNYRNEYYYKNTILNKLLLGIHSLNTTTALSEISISTSKADFILINGKAVVYEIKTELDNLERLEMQVKNYYKAFNYVCVITCDNYAKLITEKFKNLPVGVYVLSNKDTIQRKKEPLECNRFLNLSEIFKVLNKSEFECIIKSYYGYLPVTSQVRYYRECKKLFCNIPIDICYDLFLKELKKRNRVVDKGLFNNVPYELKSLVYFSQYKEKDFLKLEDFLDSEIGGVN